MVLVLISIIIVFLLSHAKGWGKKRACIVLAFALSIIPLFRVVNSSNDLMRYTIKYNQLPWVSFIS